MTRSSTVRRSTLLAAAAAIPLCVGLTACQPANVTFAGNESPAPSSAAAVAPAAVAAAPAGRNAPAAGTPATVMTAATVTPAVAGAAGAGPGTVTAAITSPVSLSGTGSTSVSCSAGRVYRAHVSSAVIHGDQLSFTVTVPGYRGPGTYQSVLSATVTTSAGVMTAVASAPQVPVVITSAGGSFTAGATGTAGRTLSGSVSWTCG